MNASFFKLLNFECKIFMIINYLTTQYIVVRAGPHSLNGGALQKVFMYWFLLMKYWKYIQKEYNL